MRGVVYLTKANRSHLALHEVLLAGCSEGRCPHRAPFSRDGVTATLVDRLSPVAKCVTNDVDEASLLAFVDGIHRIRQMDWHLVRAAAAEVFGTEHIAGQTIDTQPTAHSCGQPLIE